MDSVPPVPPPCESAGAVNGFGIVVVVVVVVVGSVRPESRVVGIRKNRLTLALLSQEVVVLSELANVVAASVFLLLLLLLLLVVASRAVDASEISFLSSKYLKRYLEFFSKYCCFSSL